MEGDYHEKVQVNVIIVGGFCIGVACSVPVFAADVETNTPVSEEVVCVETVQYETISDLDTLWEMTLASSVAPFSAEEESDEFIPLSVSQITEQRTYSDGSVEKDYDQVNFFVSSLANVDAPGSKQISDGGYGVYYTLRANYTVRSTDILLPLTCRLNNITATVQNTTTDFAAKQCTLYTKVFGKSATRTYTCQATSNPQTFTLTSPNSSFDQLGDEPNPEGARIFFSITITTKSGQELFGRQGLSVEDLT